MVGAAKLTITKTSISGANLVQCKRNRDERGSFSRFFCEQELAPIIEGKSINQINHSFTERPGSIRGMHFQHAPFQEVKLVRCIRGAIFDVVVDLRRNSKTFRSWTGRELNAENQQMLIVPEGCAHGFQTLEPNSELVYLHTAFYAPQSEAGIRYDDPLVKIRWPKPVSDVSEKDLNWENLPLNFSGI